MNMKDKEWKSKLLHRQQHHHQLYHPLHYKNENEILHRIKKNYSSRIFSWRTLFERLHPTYTVFMLLFFIVHTVHDPNRSSIRCHLTVPPATAITSISKLAHWWEDIWGHTASHWSKFVIDFTILIQFSQSQPMWG